MLNEKNTIFRVELKMKNPNSFKLKTKIPLKVLKHQNHIMMGINKLFILHVIYIIKENFRRI